MTETDDFADRVLAKLYGFPECCVDFYVSATDEECRQAKAIGGLRLCPACASKDLAQIVNEVSAKRICPQPFPVGPRKEDFRSIVEDQRFTEDERAWLIDNKERVAPDPDPFKEALLSLHQALSELEVRTTTNIAEEPEHKLLFLAHHELAKRDLLSVVLDRLHGAMKRRIIEQIKSGHIQI